ncbi:MAG: hypothetical protein ACREXQ_04600 [Polaromonas sp.]
MDLAAKAWRLKGGGHPARASATVKKSTESNISAAFSGTDIALTLRGIEMNAAFYDDCGKQT